MGAKDIRTTDRHTTYLENLSPLEMERLMGDREPCVYAAVARNSHAIAQLGRGMAEVIQKEGRIILLGAGTSGRIAVQQVAEYIPTFGIPEGVVIAVMAGGDKAFTRAVEGAEDDEEAARRALSDLRVSWPDMVIGISASGTTPFVISGLLYARQDCHVHTVLIRNTRWDPIEEPFRPDSVIELETGPEIISGSTRLNAGTAQKLVLDRLSNITFTLLGRTYGGLMVDVKATNRKLHKRAVDIVQSLTGLPEKRARILVDAFYEWEKISTDKDPDLWRYASAIKVAVVMHHKKLISSEAMRLLKEHDGHLHKIIGDAGYEKMRAAR